MSRLPIAAAMAAALVVALGLSRPSAGQPAQNASSQPLIAQASGPVYKPPIRGAPQGRIGGATRGAVGDLPKLEVLAPDHVGWSAADQPTLYWFLSRDATQTVQFVLTVDTQAKPILEIELAKPVKAGINGLALASHGVRLQPLVEYDWSVVIVTDPGQRSSDVLAAGSIKFVPPAGELAGRLAAAPQAGKAAAYAEAGYWYDSIKILSDDVDKAGGSAPARLGRAALLEQVGLADAAAFDRRAR
ncbi:MAG: DUF928 domain-containing protein [Proteobacteria bacterium]|nr:DUF928 domain-containing protein [Pseudomonadota bacterium]